MPVGECDGIAEDVREIQGFREKVDLEQYAGKPGPA